jgi:tRNA threonylcarbamoyladenosine biosynthesis protein TsaB
MNAILGIDTAGGTAGAAVAVDGRVRAETREEAGSLHSSRLFRLVDAVLEGSGVGKEDLSAVAVSRGPGSFTGLRVGVATAKGISFSLGIAVAGVSTLEAMAWGAMPFPGIVAPLLDARKQQVYAAAYDGLSGETRLAERAWNPAGFAEELRKLSRPCLLLGSGLDPYSSHFGSPYDPFLTAPRERWPVPPSQVALLGHREVEAGRAVGPALLVPVYHRLSEAEEKKALAGI